MVMYKRTVGTGTLLCVALALEQDRHAPDPCKKAVQPRSPQFSDWPIFYWWEILGRHLKSSGIVTSHFGEKN